MEGATEGIAADIERAVRAALGSVYDVEHTSGALLGWAWRARAIVRGYTIHRVELELTRLVLVRVEGDTATVSLEGTRTFDVRIGDRATATTVDISGPATLVREPDGWKLADHTADGRLVSEMAAATDGPRAERDGASARVDALVDTGRVARVDVTIENRRAAPIGLRRAWFGRRALAWTAWSPIFAPPLSVGPHEERTVELAMPWPPDRRGRVVTPTVLLELDGAVLRLAADGSDARPLERLPLLARRPTLPWWIQLVVLTGAGAGLAGFVGAGAILTALTVMALIAVRGQIGLRSRLTATLTALAVAGLVLVAVGVTRRANGDDRLARAAADSQLAALVTAERLDLSTFDRDALVDRFVATRQEVDAARWCARAAATVGSSGWKRGPCLRYVGDGRDDDYVFATYEVPGQGWIALLAG